MRPTPPCLLVLFSFIDFFYYDPYLMIPLLIPSTYTIFYISRPNEFQLSYVKAANFNFSFVFYADPYFLFPVDAIKPPELCIFPLAVGVRF